MTRHLGGRLPVSPERWYVLIEVGDSVGGLQGRLEDTLAQCLEADTVADAAVAISPAQIAEFWSLRENMAEAERLAGPSLKHDVAVPVSRIPAFLEAAEAIARVLSARLEVNAFGHLADGNIHLNVLGHGETVTAETVHRVVHDLVASFDGSIAAEHGIGQCRAWELMRLKPAGEIDLMRRVKKTLDPDDLLNPGKVLPMA